VAVVAGAKKDGEGVAGNGMAAYGAADLVRRPRQMAVDAKDVGRRVDGMGSVLRPIFVATGTQGIRAGSNASFLRVHFVTANAGYPHVAVAA
jgi:hypothetical protein